MKDFYTHHLLKFTGCKPVKLTFPIDWYQDPYNNRSWRWYLHSFGYFKYLLNTYQESEDKAVLDFGQEIIASWIREFAGRRRSCTLKIVWQDHATALRGIWMCRFLNVCPPDYQHTYAEFFTGLNATLREHAALLLNPVFYSANSNHGMDQAYALLLLGKTLDSGKSIREATNRIRAEFAYAFTGEGVHKENSYSYHYGSLLRFAEINDEFPGILDPDNYNKIMSGAILWLAYALRPDGTYPILGDSMGSRLALNFPQSLVQLPAYEHLLYVHSCGSKGIKPPQLQNVFSRSGYAIFRSGFNDADSSNNIWHIIIKMGSLARYHYHDDEGNVVLYAHGEDWLIDSGGLNYVESDPIRRFVRSRGAHNVVAIKEMPRGAGDYLKFKHWRANDWSEDDAHPHVDFEVFLDGDTLIKRRVDFDCTSGKLTLQDQIFRHVPNPEGAYLYFHFPADKRIIIDGQRLTAGGKGKTLHMEFTSPQFQSLFLREEQPDGLPPGVTSKIMFSWEKSQCAVCEVGSSQRAEVVTQIWFE